MSKIRLGELLMQEGKVDEIQVQSALAYQRRWGKRIGQCFVQLGFISEIDLCQTLSKSLRIPLIDITKIDAAKITKEILGSVSVQIARSQRVIPIAIKEVRGKKRLVIATSDPTNYKTFDDIQFKCGLPVLVMVSPDTDIDWFIRKYYLGEREALPLNYISGISIIGDDQTDANMVPDPISTIFWDENFTGVTSVGKRPANLVPAAGSKPGQSTPVGQKKDKS